uniref:IS66 family insertion sequence element accessory protein TnpA n=1 Tax=Enterocloster clostridioformis TaxID=1531 RepID=UPI003F8FBEA3
MMEVIPINTNDNATSKADPWADRIHAFQESGLSRKEWCQQNGIPQSTLGYWIRKLQSEAAETESASDPIEVAADCPARYPYPQLVK